MMREYKILLVDDDPFILMGIGKNLEMNGYQVITAKSGEDALGLFNKNDFDLVITDLIMDDIDGLQVLQKVKALNPQIMVIILTGHGDMNSAIEAFRYGVDDYLPKPCESEELHFRVSKCLERLESIKKLKAAEEALRQAYDELESEVERRTFELMKTNEHLKREIEERKRAEETIKISEEKYRSLFETSRDGVVLANMDSHLEEANQAYLDMLGYTLDEIKGKPLRHLTPEKWHNFQQKEIIEKQVLKRGYSELFEKEYIRRDGTVFPVSIRIWLVVKDKENPSKQLMGIVRDITKKKQLQDELIRSERLAATGQLAASIAHEINSPLQGITSLLHEMKKNYIHEEELITNLDLLKGAFYRIRGTVRKLFNLNRPSYETRQLVCVNKIIGETVALLENHLKKNKIKINLNLSPQVIPIKAQPQHLGQVFMNLINNAVEAINNLSSKDESENYISIGGEITIDTCQCENIIHTKVADTGTGISPEDIQRIFDPFYSRKKTIGMGIGLTVCHDIIKQHMGTITAKNALQGGAVFTIALPVDQK